MPEPRVFSSGVRTEPEPSWGLFRWEIVVQREKKAIKFRGSGSFARIGSDPRCEIFLRQTGAPVIAYLQFTEGGMLFVDISKPSLERVRSTAVLVGTSVNVGEEAWLTLASLKNLRGASQEYPKQSDSLFIVDRSVKTGVSTGSSFKIPVGISLLGASSACQLQLKHRTLSPFHSVLYRPSDPKLPLRIIDLCAFPTTLIDGTMAAGGFVLPGSTVKIGKLSFVAKVASETAGVEAIAQRGVPIEAFTSTADAWTESPTGFHDDRKATEMGVTNDIAFMSRERPQGTPSPASTRQLGPTETSQASEEVLRAIDQLSKNLAAISSRIEVLEKRLHVQQPLQAAPQVQKELQGEKASAQAALAPEHLHFAKEEALAVWPEMQIESSSGSPDFQVVAERDEIVVLDRLVALRTTRATARMRLFAYTAVGIGCLVSIAIPVLWFSVPSGWRERIMHELSRHEPDSSAFVSDAPYSNQSLNSPIP